MEGEPPEMFPLGWDSSKSAGKRDQSVILTLFSGKDGSLGWSQVLQYVV